MAFKNILWEYKRDCIRGKWWQADAYMSYQYPDRVLRVIFPFHWLVILFWRLNRWWCDFTHQQSWIDRELRRETKAWTKFKQWQCREKMTRR